MGLVLIAQGIRVMGTPDERLFGAMFVLLGQFTAWKLGVEEFLRCFFERVLVEEGTVTYWNQFNRLQIRVPLDQIVSREVIFWVPDHMVVYQTLGGEKIPIRKGIDNREALEKLLSRHLS